MKTHEIHCESSDSKVEVNRLSESDAASLRSLANYGIPPWQSIFVHG
jgi:hypothetical protein